MHFMTALAASPALRSCVDTWPRVRRAWPNWRRCAGHPERIAESIANQPELYAQGRSCLAELPAVKQRLTQVFFQPAGDLPADPVPAGDHRGGPWPSGRADLESG